MGFSVALTDRERTSYVLVLCLSRCLSVEAVVITPAVRNLWCSCWSSCLTWCPLNPLCTSRWRPEPLLIISFHWTLSYKNILWFSPGRFTSCSLRMFLWNTAASSWSTSLWPRPGWLTSRWEVLLSEYIITAVFWNNSNIIYMCVCTCRSQWRTWVYMRMFLVQVEHRCR